MVCGWWVRVQGVEVLIFLTALRAQTTTPFSTPTATILQQGFAVTPQPANGRAHGHGIYLSPAQHLAQSLGFAPPAADGTRACVCGCVAAWLRVGWNWNKQQQQHANGGSDPIRITVPSRFFH